MGEVGLADLVELGMRAYVCEDLLQRRLGVLRFQSLVALERAQLAMHARHRRRADLGVKVGAPQFDCCTQRGVEIEHLTLIGSLGEAFRGRSQLGRRRP